MVDGLVGIVIVRLQCKLEGQGIKYLRPIYLSGGGRGGGKNPNQREYPNY